MKVTFGVFTLDAPGRLVTRNGGAVHLTPKALDLLIVLVAEAPRVVTKRELHTRLWTDTFVSDATLTGLVKELRRELDDRDRTAPVIRTAHGVGYAFGAETEGAVPTAPALPLASHWIVLRGRRIALQEGVNIVGRDPEADVWLDGTGVSRRHARIIVGETDVRLEDLGSKNGTTVRGEALDRQVNLQDGDQIGFGATPCVYRIARTGISTETRTRHTGPAQRSRE
jgi:DNA-binding winged helix-turn-helix (wHTH) protein